MELKCIQDSDDKTVGYSKNVEHCGVCLSEPHRASLFG